MPLAWLSRTLSAVLAAVTLSACLGAANAAPLQVVTEELPPYNTRVGGKVSGMCTEIVQAVFSEMGINPDIQMLPWARAYDLALHADNVMIYSVTRTPEREGLFQWVGPIASARWFLYSTHARPVILRTLQQALQQGYQIATVNQDVGEQYLTKHGFVVGQTLQQSNYYALDYEKLKQGHVALWISDELNAAYTVRTAGDDPRQVLRPSLELPELEDSGFNVAFSLGTDRQTVADFQTALARLRIDGRYDAIVRRWVGP